VADGKRGRCSQQRGDYAGKMQCFPHAHLLSGEHGAGAMNGG
jgi:hypothetical protein